MRTAAASRTARASRAACCARYAEAVGDRAAIWAKLNMEDGFAGGLTLDEGVEVGGWIEADGSVDRSS